MKILVACECSGIVRDAFKAKGHDAWSCDLQLSERNGQHRQEDVRNGILSEDWDIIIAHPVCKRLANSGVRWLNERNLWHELDEAVKFFNLFVNLKGRVCIENPIQHKYARLAIPKYNQIIQPWQFGHTTKKATCLWLKGLPKLMPTEIVPEGLRTQDIWVEPPGPDREKNRSRSFTGIAEAMADQWS